MNIIMDEYSVNDVVFSYFSMSPQMGSLATLFGEHHVVSHPDDLQTVTWFPISVGLLVNQAKLIRSVQHRHNWLLGSMQVLCIFVIDMFYFVSIQVCSVEGISSRGEFTIVPEYWIPGGKISDGIKWKLTIIQESKI